MIIRPGTIDEMFSRWYKFHTSDFFAENLQSGNAEFWAIDLNGSIIGELYLFKRLDDRDFADGETTAYLYGFYIDEAYRGRGMGKRLMNRVLERLCELGFQYATLGVEPDRQENVRLYTKMGFTEEVKTTTLNPCDVDEAGMPVPYPEYLLLRKPLR